MSPFGENRAHVGAVTNDGLASELRHLQSTAWGEAALGDVR
jgi:hypothetical protein